MMHAPFLEFSALPLAGGVCTCICVHMFRLRAKTISKAEALTFFLLELKESIFNCDTYSKNILVEIKRHQKKFCLL